MQIDLTQFDIPHCECGMAHQTPNKLSMIEENASDHLTDIAASLGCKAEDGIAVYDSNTYQVLSRRPKVKEEIVLPAQGLHANEHGIALLKERLGDCKFLYAIGSGTIHDITRFVAFERKIPFLSVPTACSVDAFASHSCSLTLNNLKVTVLTEMPLAIVADTNILCHAPLYLSLSGVGDMFGKYTALVDWKIASLLGAETYCDRIAALQEEALGLVRESCMHLEEKDANAYQKLIYGLILSGIAMQVTRTSRPASGAEHYISHFWEIGGLGVQTSALHGEKVGVGTLMAMQRYQEIAAQGETFLDSLVWQPVSDDQLHKIFAPSLFDEIKKHNTPDCLDAFSLDDLHAKWPKIEAAIRTLPDREKLLALYQQIGVKSKMEELGIDPALFDATIQNSPYARNKVTLLRIAARSKQ